MLSIIIKNPPTNFKMLDFFTLLKVTSALQENKKIYIGHLVPLWVEMVSNCRQCKGVAVFLVSYMHLVISLDRSSPVDDGLQH